MTLKQKKAMQKVLENGGNVAKAMREVGYSPSTVNKPGVLTKSKAWEELLSEYLPDELLTRKLEEGLEAMKQLSARIIVKKGASASEIDGELQTANSRTDDFVEVEDLQTRHKYLETALKVKGRLLNKIDLTTNGKDLVNTLNSLETDYGDLGQKIAGQSMAFNPLVQDKGQAGEISDILSEPDTTKASS